MNGPKASASAQVTVTLVIQVGGGTWGENCTVSQVHKQAIDGARNKLNALLAKEPGIRMVGEFKVEMITHDMER